jgi:hypothetical protein
MYNVYNDSDRAFEVVMRRSVVVIRDRSNKILI